MFLAGLAGAGALPIAAAAAPRGPRPGPVVLTVGGAVVRSNRAPLDPALDQMMVKHGVRFTKAFAFDAAALQRLPATTLRPTLEYDSRVHALSGPLISVVLDAVGVDAAGAVQLGLRAVDGYNAIVKLDDARRWRMIVATHIDGRPLPLGGLGPQWAVYEADTVAPFKDQPLKERFAHCPWGLYHIDVAPA